MNNTIKEVYQNYLEYSKLKNKLTTVQHEYYKFINYVIPFFGNKKIGDITKNDFISFQASLLNLDYSNSFYSDMNSLCKKFWTYLNLIYDVENLSARVGNIQNKNTRVVKEKQTWTKKEFKKFINKVNEPIYHALFDTLFYTGIRKGEALALKISDLKCNYISISGTLTKECFNGKRIITSPKSRTSIRNVPIDLILSKELKRLIEYYKKNYPGYNEDFFLFGGNKPISTTTLERKKNEYCKLAEVKQIRIHDLRHSHATILYNKNVKVKTIQERLGHADISTTLNTYVHTNIKEQKRLIKKINLLRMFH